jgi:hypothetical protein
MKNTIASKDYNYSLHNIENYKKELNSPINEIVKKYLNLLVEYYKFIIENIKIKNKQFTHFIIMRGLDTITNVFLILLLYTKNVDLTYFHCQKSFYFYVEFVGQISEDEKMFLQLTSRDASTYVYKKTIFEINSEFKKMNDDMNAITRDKFEIINFYTSLCKNYLLKVIEKADFNKNEELLNLIEETLDKLNRNISKEETKSEILPIQYKSVRLWKLLLRDGDSVISCSMVNKIRQIEKDNMLLILSPINEMDYQMTIMEQWIQ